VSLQLRNLQPFQITQFATPIQFQRGRSMKAPISPFNCT